MSREFCMYIPYKTIFGTESFYKTNIILSISNNLWKSTFLFQDTNSIYLHSCHIHAQHEFNLHSFLHSLKPTYEYIFNQHWADCCHSKILSTFISFYLFHNINILSTPLQTVFRNYRITSWLEQMVYVLEVV